MVSDKGKTKAQLGIELEVLKCRFEQSEASAAKYREIFDSVNDFVLVHDAETGAVLDANRKLQEWLGYDIEEFRRLTVGEFSAEELGYTQEKAIELISRAASGEPQLFEWLVKGKNGCLIWVEVNLKAAFIGGEKRLIAVARDITERKKTEKALAEERNILRTLIDNLPDHIYVKDTESRFVVCNRTCARNMAHTTPDNVVGKTDFDFYPRKMAQQFYADERRVIETGEPIINREEPGWDYAGNEIWGLTTKVPLRDKEGKIVGIVGMGLDITERKLAEKMLELRNRAIEAATDGIVITEHEATDNPIIYVNLAFERMTGYSADELLGRDCRFLQGDDREQAALEDVRRAVREGRGCRVTLRNYRKDTSMFFNELSISPVFDERGNLTHFVGVISDITERKHAEDSLRQSRRMLRTVLDNIPVRVFWKDCESVYLGCNRVFAEDAGVGRPENIIGKTDYDLAWEKEETDFFRECDHRVMESGRAEYHIVEPQLHADGKRAWLDTNKVPLLDEAGSVVGILGTYEDITERKQVEQERERLLKTLAAKNKELESIVYVSSHDLRSPLVNIEGFSAELGRTCEQIASIVTEAAVPKEIEGKLSYLLDRDIPTSLEYIRASTSRMDVLLNGLLRLSRLGSAALEITTVDMNSVVRDILKGMQHQITECGATITVEQLPGCKADVVQINEVFTNLFDNALKYLHPERKGRIRVSGKVQDGYCVYSIEDNGIGIAADHQEKIFEVFHRLAPDGSVAGEGLGLTIVKRILDLQEGDIRVESGLEKGSVFYVTLPTA